MSGFILALLTYILMIKFNHGETNSVRRTGHISMQGLSGLILAALVGAIQTWIFRNNIKEKHIFLFFLSSIAGGFIGGAIVGGLLKLGIFSNVIIEGALIGGIAGCLSGFGQILLMSNQNFRYKWLLFCIFGWACIWALGWFISINLLSNSGYGMAAAAAFIVIVSGIGLSLFLLFNPEIEF